MRTVAAELRRITHELRNSLSVLQVGTELLQRAKVHGSELASDMLTKITHINGCCERLSQLSEHLKKT